jgi:beta-glucanase (GH16 family)
VEASLIADDRRMHASRKLLPALLVAVAVSLVYTSTASAVAPPPTSTRFPKMIFYRQFKDPMKPHTWTVYQGTPGCCNQSYWAKSHVVSKAGMLRIQTYKDPAFGGRWVSGGVSMARLVNQTYGRWVVRFRMPRGTGVGMDVALRPSGSGTVVDWIEESSDKGAARAIETATLHYGSTRVHAHVQADFTKWHTMILAWTPGHITVRLGHHLWANYTSHVPSSPMHMVMQTNVGTNGFTGVMPNSSTPSRVTLYVDYVAVYKYH